jgi:hypothetical protein
MSEMGGHTRKSRPSCAQVDVSPRADASMPLGASLRQVHSRWRAQQFSARRRPPPLSRHSEIGMGGPRRTVGRTEKGPELSRRRSSSCHHEPADERPCLLLWREPIEKTRDGRRMPRVTTRSLDAARV